MDNDKVNIEDFLVVVRAIAPYFGVTSIKRDNEHIFHGNIFFWLSTINMVTTGFFETIYIVQSIMNLIPFDLPEICFIIICVSYMSIAIIKIVKKELMIEILHELKCAKCFQEEV